MAGGEGTRLRPLTSNAPKPMMPVANRPMMEHVVGLLRQHGFDEIVVTVAFMANAIRTYFGDGSEFGVKMVYATEETPLGTAGSVRNAKDVLDERFLVISGDVLTDIDLGAIVKRHEERGAMASIALKSMENPWSSASSSPRKTALSTASSRSPPGVRYSATRSIPAFTCSSRRSSITSPRAAPFDFSEEVFPALLRDNKPLYGDIVEGFWEDVGTLEAYLDSPPRRPRCQGRSRRSRLPARRRDLAGGGG